MTTPAPDTRRARRWPWIAGGATALIAAAIIIAVVATTNGAPRADVKLVPARPGETVQIITTDGVAAADLTITSADTDPTCTGTTPRPDGAHTVLLHVVLQTHSQPDAAVGATNAANYKVRDSSGDTHTAMSGTCVAAPPAVFAYAPNSTYNLLVELQTEASPAAVLLPIDGVTVPGWEWPLAA